MAAAVEMRQTTSGLGGAATVTEVSSSPMNNIFDNVSGAEATAGDINYRAIDLYNDGDALAILSDIGMSSPTSSTDTSFDMGIETVHIDSTLSIAVEADAPAGVSFAHYTDSSPLSTDDIPAGSYARIWIKRIVTAGASNTAEDIGTISYSFA